MASKKMSNKSLSVYVATCVDRSPRYGDESNIIGIYAGRGEALDGCISFILDRVHDDPLFFYAFSHNVNHPEVANLYAECVNPDKKACELVRDMLGGDSHYSVATDDDSDESFVIKVDELDLEGLVQLHTVVTVVTGADDTTPTPESFFSKSDMYDHIRNEITDYWRDHHASEIDRKFLNGVIAHLRDFGTAQVPISGDIELHYAVWSQEIGNEVKK